MRHQGHQLSTTICLTSVQNPQIPSFALGFALCPSVPRWILTGFFRTGFVRTIRGRAGRKNLRPVDLSLVAWLLGLPNGLVARELVISFKAGATGLWLQSAGSNRPRAGRIRTVRLQYFRPADSRNASFYGPFNGDIFSLFTIGVWRGQKPPKSFLEERRNEQKDLQKSENPNSNNAAKTHETISIYIVDCGPNTR